MITSLPFCGSPRASSLSPAAPGVLPSPLGRRGGLCPSLLSARTLVSGASPQTWAGAAGGRAASQPLGTAPPGHDTPRAAAKLAAPSQGHGPRRCSWCVSVSPAACAGAGPPGAGGMTLSHPWRVPCRWENTGSAAATAQGRAQPAPAPAAAKPPAWTLTGAAGWRGRTGMVLPRDRDWPPRSRSSAVGTLWGAARAVRSAGGWARGGRAAAGVGGEGSGCPGRRGPEKVQRQQEAASAAPRSLPAAGPPWDALLPFLRVPSCCCGSRTIHNSLETL